MSKEQIAAQLTALQHFARGAYEAELPAKRRLLEQVAAALEGLPVRCRMIVPADGETLPLLEIAVDEVLEVCRRLRRGRPAVHVGQALLGEGKLVLNPLHLNEERTAALIGRLRAEVSPPGPAARG